MNHDVKFSIILDTRRRCSKDELAPRKYACRINSVCRNSFKTRSIRVSVKSPSQSINNYNCKNDSNTTIKYINDYFRKREIEDWSKNELIKKYIEQF